jgi:hypothetical protein
MKQGKTLVELATELERQSKEKHDLIVRTPNATLSLDATKLELRNGDTIGYELKPLAHEQLGDRVGIPRKYYQKLQAQFPGLLALNVNTLLPTIADSFLVRTLDGKARAVLSNKFRCLDSKPLFETVVPVLVKGGFEIASCEVTDTRFYLKVISNQMTAKLNTKVGDMVRAGFWFRNSEVGHSRLAGGLFMEVLDCTNGMMFTKDYGFARNHSGKALDFSEAVEGYFTHETRITDDRAYWMKVHDVVNGMIGSKEGFEGACQRIEAAAAVKLDTHDTTKLLEGVQEVFSLNTTESNGVLQYIIKGGDDSLWGLSNALTRYSQDVPDYDRASDFETMGAQVIELPHSQYSVLI